MKHFIKLRRRYTHYCFLRADHFTFVHLHCHAYRGGTVALTRACLKHPDTAILNGKLQILHIPEVSFQPVTNGPDLGVGLGHSLFQRGMSFDIVGMTGFFIDRIRRANTRDDIFALRIGQPFTVEFIFAGGRVAGKGHAGCGIFSHIAENHRLHIYRRAPVIGDSFNAAISNSSFAVPALEDRADRAP